ncbi:hypothetical protein LWI29_010206 [Acer saccharum]|uniref:Uncharacterized protein n=1 Tax=Acer saccharum TaxID=4024 RepID=A0AA39VNN0_ACESA|nr:hypothetical protein LWI29_010206 [Acer saccharum]
MIRSRHRVAASGGKRTTNGCSTKLGEQGFSEGLVRPWLENEYVKAYYDALLKKQQELEEAVTKQREFSNAPISDALSEAPVAGNVSETYKVNDLNVEAEDSEEDEDDIDWEEG